MKPAPSLPLALLGVVRDLMLGGRHSRQTVAKSAQVSLPTADRWLGAIAQQIPGMRKIRISNTTWYEWRGAAR